MREKGGPLHLSLYAYKRVSAIFNSMAASEGAVASATAALSQDLSKECSGNTVDSNRWQDRRQLPGHPLPHNEHHLGEKVKRQLQKHSKGGRKPKLVTAPPAPRVDFPRQPSGDIQSGPGIAEGTCAHALYDNARRIRSRMSAQGEARRNQQKETTQA